ncbi:MAG: hypothetical protein ACI9YL_001604 [Luteibaculaceae bacterium]
MEGQLSESELTIEEFQSSKSNIESFAGVFLKYGLALFLISITDLRIRLLENLVEQGLV